MSTTEQAVIDLIAGMRRDLRQARATIGNPMGEIKAAWQLVRDAETKLTRLEASIPKRPATADGVSVVTGMELFGISATDGRIIRLHAGEPVLFVHIDDCETQGEVWDVCAHAYSTERAAELARREGVE